MLSSFMKIMQSFIFMRNIKKRVEKVWWNLFFKESAFFGQYQALP